MFRSPSATSYGEIRDFAATDRLTPEFAPAEFALALRELELA